MDSMVRYSLEIKTYFFKVENISLGNSDVDLFQYSQ